MTAKDAIAKIKALLSTETEVEETVNLEEIQKRLNLDPTEPTPILITLLIWLLKLMRIGMVAFWGIAIIIIRRFGNNTAF